MNPALGQRRRRTAGLVPVLLCVLATSTSGRAEDPPPTAAAPVASVVAPATAPAADPWEGMVLIEGGSFDMGTTTDRDAQAQPNEGPRHSVTLAAYRLDRTEVSVAAYRACVTNGGCVAPTLSSAACTFDKGDGEAAMNCVSFAEADRFCLAHDKRLPTEAEWEHAAAPPPSAGPVDPKTPVFPWGTAELDCAHAGSTRFQPCDSGRRVGQRSLGRSAAGIDDLAANLQEWVADFYDERHVVGPSLRQGVAHVLRGGHYRSRGGADLRVTARSWGSPVERGPTTGFRCARSANPLFYLPILSTQASLDVCRYAGTAARPLSRRRAS
jgi:formylglycine-generating enzyme